MFSGMIRKARGLGVSIIAAGTLLTGATAFAGDDKAVESKAPDSTLAAWLGQEFTVHSAKGGYMPNGGKLTFTYDSANKVVRVCTRSVKGQDGEWLMDFSKDCAVTMSFTAGTRYCTEDDVKAGNAEILASCHRLRSPDVAMRGGESKGAVEVNDVVAFLVNDADGTKSMAILVESPSRMTGTGVIVVRP